MSKFKPGDIVELRSSGPEMVVEIDFGDGSYKCSWFAGAKHHDQIFVEAALTKVQGE